MTEQILTTLKGFIIRHKKALRWLLAAVCLGYIVVFCIRNYDQLSFIANLAPAYLIGVLILSFIHILLHNFRLLLVLRQCSEQAIPFWGWFKLAILGRFLNSLAPQAGNIYRSISLKNTYQVSYTRYISTLFAFSWFSTSLNFVFAGVAIMILAPELYLFGLPLGILLLLAAAFIVIIPPVFDAFFRKFNFRNKTLNWLHEKIAEMLSVTVRSLSSGRFMLKFAFTNLLTFVVILGMFELCFSAINVTAELTTLILLYIVLKLSAQIIITPGNIGVRELAYGILTEQMRIGMAQGIAVSVIIRIIDNLFVFSLGLFLGGFELLGKKQELINENSHTAEHNKEQKN